MTKRNVDFLFFQKNIRPSSGVPVMKFVLLFCRYIYKIMCGDFGNLKKMSNFAETTSMLLI